MVLTLQELLVGTWSKEHHKKQDKSKKGGANGFCHGNEERQDYGEGKSNAKGKRKGKKKRKVPNKLTTRVEMEPQVDLSFDNNMNLGMLAKKHGTSLSKEKTIAMEGSKKELPKKPMLTHAMNV